MGTSHEEYQNLAKKNQMDDLHLEIIKLRDRVTAIQRNQDYAKVRIPTRRGGRVRLDLWTSLTSLGISYCPAGLTGKKLDLAVINRKQQPARHVGFSIASEAPLEHANFFFLLDILIMLRRALLLADCDLACHGLLSGKTSPSILPQEETCVDPMSKG